MKRNAQLEIACLRCHKSDLRHYAKGLCVNCYMNAYYHSKVKIMQNIPKINEEMELSPPST